MKRFLRIVSGDQVKENYYSTKTEARKLTKKITGTITFSPVLQESFREELHGSYDTKRAEEIYKRCDIIKYDTGSYTTENQYKKQARRCEPCDWGIVMVCRVDNIVFSSIQKKVNN